MSKLWMRARAVDHRKVQAGPRTYRLQSLPGCIQPLAALRAYLRAAQVPELDAFNDSGPILGPASGPEHVVWEFMQTLQIYEETTNGASEAAPPNAYRYYGTAPDSEVLARDLLDAFDGYYDSSAFSEPLNEEPSLCFMDFLVRSPEELGEYYAAFVAPGTEQGEFIKRIRNFQAAPLIALKPFDTRFINLNFNLAGIGHCATLDKSIANTTLGYFNAGSGVVFTPKDSVFEAPREADQILLLPGLFDDRMPRPDLDGINVYSVSVDSANGTAEIGLEKDTALSSESSFKVIVDDEALDRRELWHLIQGLAGDSSLQVTLHGQQIDACGIGEDTDGPEEWLWITFRDEDENEARCPHQ